MFAILGKGKWLVRRFQAIVELRGISVLNRKLKRDALHVAKSLGIGGETETLDEVSYVISRVVISPDN